MTPNEYVELAARTECSQEKAGRKITDCAKATPRAMRMMHAACGMSAESGEIQSAIQKWLWYGQDFPDANVIEELGDLLWYVSLACRALDISMEEVMEKNIKKLRQRYPEKYTDVLAAEENRDRVREQEAAWHSPKPILTPMDVHNPSHRQEMHKCWYCKMGTGELLFSTEFDTPVHKSCLDAAAMDPSDQEARIMAREFRSSRTIHEMESEASGGAE